MSEIPGEGQGYIERSGVPLLLPLQVDVVRLIGNRCEQEGKGAPKVRVETGAARVAHRRQEGQDGQGQPPVGGEPLFVQDSSPGRVDRNEEKHV